MGRIHEKTRRLLDGSLTPGYPTGAAYYDGPVLLRVREMLKHILRIITLLMCVAFAHQAWSENFTSDASIMAFLFWLFLHLMLWVKSAF